MIRDERQTELLHTKDDRGSHVVIYNIGIPQSQL